MMYWVVFACFLAVEMVADILVSWYVLGGDGCVCCDMDSVVISDVRKLCD